MNIIGITGSSGAGKSTVCDILQEKYDVKVIDADKIAKHLSKSGTEYVKEIAEKFGKNILNEAGELKRKELAELIYAEPEKRKCLNSCTFKYIRKEIENEIRDESVASTIVIDAPLLFECELNRICNYVIGVISQKKLQIDRIMVRDNVDYEHAVKRLSAQKQNEFYITKCDNIIENNNDMSHIERCVDIIAEKCNITKRLQ